MITKKIIIIFICIIILFSTHTGAHVKLNSSLTQKYKVTLGGEYSGHLDVVNSGKKAVTVKIYKKDYSFNAQGKSYYLRPGKIERSNCNWIKLNSELIEIPGGVSKKIYYSIKVPSNNNLKGTYWSILMVEPLNISSHKPLSKGKKIAIKQKLRYGVQIVTTIGDTGKSNLKIYKPELVKKNNNYTFNVNLLNQGERWLIPEVWLEVYKKTGEKVNKYYGRKSRIYPQTSICQHIFMPEIKPGNYIAVLIVDNGGNEVFGCRYNIKIK